MHRTLGIFLIFVFLAAAGFAADDSMVAVWREKAEAGDALFQTLIGASFEDGSFGSPKDGAEAVRWYQLAAEQGYANGQYMLGLFYQKNDFALIDNIEAVKWLRLAAQQRHVKAQFELGKMCALGRGVAKNELEAFIWFYVASRGGYDPRDEDLLLMAGVGGRIMNPERKKLAEQYYIKFGKIHVYKIIQSP